MDYNRQSDILLNLPQTLVWIANHIRQFTSTDAITHVMIKLAEWRMNLPRPTLMEAYCRLQGLFDPSAAEFDAPLASYQPETVTRKTAFGEGIVIGADVEQPWRQALVALIDQLCAGRVEMLARRMGRGETIAVPKEAVVGLKFIDHDEPMAVSSNFPEDELFFDMLRFRASEILRIWAAPGWQNLPQKRTIPRPTKDETIDTIEAALAKEALSKEQVYSRLRAAKKMPPKKIFEEAWRGVPATMKLARGQKAKPSR